MSQASTPRTRRQRHTYFSILHVIPSDASEYHHYLHELEAIFHTIYAYVTIYITIEGTPKRKHTYSF